MGPIPKPDAIRRNARVGPVQLPAEGRIGRAPLWPLAVRPTKDESACWAFLWSLPQAVMWEKQALYRTIARYVRMLGHAEKPDATAAIHMAVTALEDRIGLNPKAMRLLMWQVADDEVAQRRAETAGSNARKRFRAVE